MANIGANSFSAVDPSSTPTSVDKVSIAGDLKCIAKIARGTVVAQNTETGGSFEYVGKYKQITVWMTSVRAGSLTIKQSMNGSNTDYTTTYATVAGTPIGLLVEIILPFAKVTWTEGDVGTSVTTMAAFAKMV